MAPLRGGHGCVLLTAQPDKNGISNRLLETEVERWMEATKALLEAGKNLLNSEDSTVTEFIDALNALHTSTGQQEPLPNQPNA